MLKAWGFTYKSNIVWHKVRKDGGSDGRGVGFYFRNVTELILFGVRGKNARTLAPGRRQVNLLGDAQARAFAQARRAVRHHRGVLARPVRRTVRPRHAKELGNVGQSGRRRLHADVEDLRTSFAGGADCG